MADIAEFAERAASQFCDSQKDIEEQYNLGLPSVAVEELVKAAYYGSLIPDEGRYPAVCLMCYRQGCESGFHFAFEDPLPPTAQNIAKLAQAVGPGSHLSCLCKEGKVWLAGIHVTTLNEMREFGYSTIRVANPLKVQIWGPGHIEMSTGGLALIYKAGVVFEERVFQGSCAMSNLDEAVTHVVIGAQKGPTSARKRVPPGFRGSLFGPGS